MTIITLHHLFFGHCVNLSVMFGPRHFSSGATLPQKNTSVQNNHLRFHTMTSKKILLLLLSKCNTSPLQHTLVSPCFKFSIKFGITQRAARVIWTLDQKPLILHDLPKWKVNWVVILINVSRGAHLLFIWVGLDYYYIYCCEWVTSPLHDKPVTSTTYAGTHLIHLGGVGQMRGNALPKCTKHVTWYLSALCRLCW